MLGLPPTVKLHLVLAWCIFFIVPFTRLVHIFLPLAYFWRPPQRWCGPPIGPDSSRLREAVDARRHFMKGALGVTAAAFLLSVGVLDKLARFFRMPSMAPSTSRVAQKKLTAWSLPPRARWNWSASPAPTSSSRSLRNCRPRTANTSGLPDAPALAFRDEVGFHC